jgi:hypothetical protein
LIRWQSGPLQVKDWADGVTAFREGEKKRSVSWLEHSEPVVLICYCLVAGFYLFLIPWSRSWEDNIFFQWSDTIGQLAMNPALRGGVSGIGLVLIFLGLAEFLRLFLRVIRR